MKFHPEAIKDRPNRMITGVGAKITGHGTQNQWNLPSLLPVFVICRMLRRHDHQNNARFPAFF